MLNFQVEVRNVDLGNRLPLIPWTEIARIKPLRYLLAFRDAPLVGFYFTVFFTVLLLFRRSTSKSVS